MAESTDNVVMHGMKGIIGRMLVFRQKGGKTFVSRKPKKTAPLTPAQIAVNDKFQLATVYAVAAISDPAIKAEYEQMAGTNQSAYNVAIADFFNAPEILDTDISAYTGAVGSKIKVKATDDFKVKSVKVRITNAGGALIEEGLVVPEADGLHWLFPATQSNPSLTGDPVSVSVTDMPDNVTVKTKTLV
jgi:hypothetical protein